MGAEFNLIPYTYVLNGATQGPITNATLPVPDGATAITYADPLLKITVNGNERAVGKYIKNNSNALVMQVVDLGTFLITAALSSGASSMTLNMQKGLNALRCAFLNGFSNSDKLVEAAIYAAW
jgi:hypothetical protein